MLKTQTPHTDRRLATGLFVIAAALLALHAWYYLPFISDDALISLRYSKRLIAGEGLTWNAGERVEGYSNVLWVLLTALVGLAGVDLIDAARSLGFLGMGACLAAVVYAHRLESFKTALPVMLALLFLPLSGAMAVWTIGGLEQPLVAGLLAWAVVLCYPLLERRDASFKEMQLPGLLFALLCLTRLDGPLFTAAAVAALLLVGGGRRDSLRKAAALALLPVLFYALQIIFRLAYYGEWVPNTALVKFNPSGKHTFDGWQYLRAGAYVILPLVALAAASLFVSLRFNYRRARMVFLLAPLVAWAAYLVAIGGDIFPAWRHFVPLVVLLVLMTAEGAAWAARHASRRAYAVTIVAGALLVCLFTFQQFRDAENFRALSERWEWDGQVVGTLLRKAFAAEQPLVAVDPAGCLPYWSELPSLDMLGLNDYYLPRHPPANFGGGAIGHELGDGQYVLNRRPDLVIFLLPTGNDAGYFLSGRQMQQDPRFFRDYTLVRFEGREPYTVRSRVWVRKESERIGIRRTPDEIVVPGFLLCDNQTSVARLGGEGAGQLVVPVTPSEPARIDKLELPAGRWRVEARGFGAPLKVVVAPAPQASAQATQNGGTAKILLDAQTPATFELTDGGALRIEVTTATGAAAELRELVLTRVRD